MNFKNSKLLTVVINEELLLMKKTYIEHSTYFHPLFQQEALGMAVGGKCLGVGSLLKCGFGGCLHMIKLVLQF